MCVPGIITAYSHSSVFATSSGSEVSATWPVMPSPMRVRGKSTRSPLRESELAAEGDRHDLVALDHRDAAVVVIDQQPELVGDHLADLAHVVQPVQLAGEALQHLQVRDRADVAAARGLAVRAARSRASSKRTIWFLPRALAVIIAASAQATSSRGFIACSGPCEMPTEMVILPAGAELDLAERLGQALREASASAASPLGMITPNSSPPSRQTTSEPRSAPRSSSARSVSTWSPEPWP